jgi:hypothetical protein
VEPVAVRVVEAVVLLLIAFVVMVAPVSPAPAQQYVQIDGTVMWISGDTLTLRTDVPSTTGYPIGQYWVPVPGPSLTVSCDLRRVPQGDYAHMRPGERVGVIGVISSDGRRLTATSIIRSADLQAP